MKERRLTNKKVNKQNLGNQSVNGQQSDTQRCIFHKLDKINKLIIKKEAKKENKKVKR